MDKYNAFGCNFNIIVADGQWVPYRINKQNYYSAFGTAANGSASMDEHTTQKLLEEEAAAMEKFRVSFNF